MLSALRAQTLLRGSSSCFRLTSRPHLSTLSVRKGPCRYDTTVQTQARLFFTSTHRPFPRSAAPIRKPDPEAVSVSKDNSRGVTSYLSEVAKEEQSTFDRDASRFRAQLGLPPLPRVRERHSRLSSSRLHRSDRSGGGASRASASESESESGSKSEPPPRFREEVLKEDPTFEQPKFEEGIGRPGIWRQIAFVGLVSLAVFGNAAELTSFDTKRLSAMFPSPFMVTNDQLRRVRLGMLSEKLKKTLQQLKDALSGLPNSLTYPILWSYVQLANGYINASEGKRIAYQICAINGFVWLLWQFRVLRPFMNKNFTHHPLSGRVLTLFTSIFSHESFIHLLANSFALISFGSAASAYLTKRQQANPEGRLESTPKYHFWAMFVTAGLVSALVSHVVSARLVFPRLLAEARASKAAEGVAAATASAFRRVGSVAKDKAGTATRKDILPSLGASGAIYATVTMTALAFPDAQVFLLFPPIPLPITWGVGAMVTLDVIGIIRGWRLFDHWAHIGGAAFGALYWKYGPEFWNGLAKRAESQSTKS